MVNPSDLQDMSTEQLAIAIHTPQKIKQLMQEKPSGTEMVAVHRFKLGLIFYRKVGNQLQAYYTDTASEWQETRSRDYAELKTALNAASFLLCNVELLEKELSLHGYSDKPIPVLDRIYSELGVMHESTELRQENAVQTKDYWNGYKQALESVRLMIQKLNV